MNKPLKKISVCQPTLTGKEWPYVKDCLDTNWISSNGKYIEKFEKNFSRFCGVKFGISCTSGTTALHLALAAAGIKKGDEVINVFVDGDAKIGYGRGDMFTVDAGGKACLVKSFFDGRFFYFSKRNWV